MWQRPVETSWLLWRQCHVQETSDMVQPQEVEYHRRAQRGPKCTNKIFPTPLHHHYQAELLTQSRIGPRFPAVSCKFWPYHTNAAEAKTLKTGQWKKKIITEKSLSLKMWDVFCLLLWIKYWFMKCANHCSPILSSSFDVTEQPQFPVPSRQEMYPKWIQRCCSANLGCNQWLKSSSILSGPYLSHQQEI